MVLVVIADPLTILFPCGSNHPRNFLFAAVKFGKLALATLLSLPTAFPDASL